MRIGEVATQSGVSVDTVRFYERMGVLPAPAREPSGYRDYAADTVARIRLTRELQAVGFTLNDVIGALAARCRRRHLRVGALAARRCAGPRRREARRARGARGRIVDAREACAAGRCRFTAA